MGGLSRRSANSDYLPEFRTLKLFSTNRLLALLNKTSILYARIDSLLQAGFASIALLKHLNIWIPVALSLSSTLISLIIFKNNLITLLLKKFSYYSTAPSLDFPIHISC